MVVMRGIVGILMVFASVVAAVFAVLNAFGKQPVTALLLGAGAVVALVVALKALNPYIWGILRSREDF